MVDKWLGGDEADVVKAGFRNNCCCDDGVIAGCCNNAFIVKARCHKLL